MGKYFIVAVIAVLSALQPLPASGHETDQYTVPLGREFADLRFYFSNQVYNRIASAVEKTNERIRSSLRDGQSTDKTKELQSPDVIAKAVWSEFPYFLYHIETWGIILRGQEVRTQFPGMIVAYKPTFWVYHHPLLILNPTKLVRLKRTYTIMINGTYFGTDKISHFIDMGYIYYKRYRKDIKKGLSDEKAVARAVSVSAGGHFFFSESAILGKFTTGIRSNADLASDYVGFKFFRNLTEGVRVQGKMQPPMLVRDGIYWKLNDHVGPHSDFFSVFISDHFNEALNPSTYIFGVTTFVRKMVRRRCDEILLWYHDEEGLPRTKEYFERIAEELSTYYGEDYGHVKRPDRMATIADTCFDDNEQSGNVNSVGSNRPKPFEGTGVNSADRFGRTALWWAAARGHVEEVERLLKLGADVNAADIDGEGPLHSAVRWGHAGVADVLLSYGADPDARSYYGVTPLHMAAHELQRDVINVLLEHGANVNARDMFGITPLHDVAARGDESLAVLLVTAGAEPDAQDVKGTTPLHRAARAGNTGVAAKLLSFGATASIRNSLGRTPFDEAMQTRSEEVLNCLVDYSESHTMTLTEE